MILVILVIFATSTANASEITGVLNSSGSAPMSHEENPPALAGLMTANYSGQLNDPSDTPVTVNTPATEISSQTSPPQMILSSYTDTTNLPAGNSLAEYAPLSEDSDNFAILHRDTAPTTKLSASATMGSSANMSIWWWVATLFFVISLFAGLYTYRPRHNERYWLDRQY